MTLPFSRDSTNRHPTSARRGRHPHGWRHVKLRFGGWLGRWLSRL